MIKHGQILFRLICFICFSFCISQQTVSAQSKKKTDTSGKAATASAAVKDSSVEKLDVKKFQANNIVFLLDISSSMAKDNKMLLLRKSMEVLLVRLRKIDKVHLITFGNTVNLLYSTNALTGPDSISKALKSVRSIASATNINGGIQYAYELAMERFIKNGNNEIMLITDGEFVLNKYTVALVNEHPEIRLTSVVVGSDRGSMQAAAYIRGTLRLPVVELVNEISDLEVLLNNVKKHALATTDPKK